MNFRRNRKSFKKECQNCPAANNQNPPHGGKKQNLPKIALVGTPNVGKSVIFNCLTGTYTTVVSNYPGTTVDVTRGSVKTKSAEYELIDTPGMYSMYSITEEERVSRWILMDEKPELVLHVVDAKNLERQLAMTLQLIEARYPMMLVLNMMDEAEREGVEIDIDALQKLVGIPVLPTVAADGKGIPQLLTAIDQHSKTSHLPEDAAVISYSPLIEEAMEKIGQFIDTDVNISKRSLSLLLLQNDNELVKKVVKNKGDNRERYEAVLTNMKTHLINPIEYELAIKQKAAADEITGKVLKLHEDRLSFAERLSRFTMHPVSGIALLLLVLYWGLYKFVGEFGAGTVVNYLEGTIFAQYVNPFVEKLFTDMIPWETFRSLFTGEYGLITMGVRYALALLLPIVTFFFIVFSIIEDSGYLPRLAMLIDTVFKKIGLSGRAVIPIVLGFGCDTMATMVTRTLPTKRERVISTMLLALAIPCSAQLGVIMALLESKPKAFYIWAFVITLVFLFIGFLTAQILPGKRPSFYMEIPPLRLPKLTNVLTKTFVRVKWYFKEVIPLFALASLLIWIGQLLHVFDFLVKLLVTPVQMIGMPAEAAKVFLFGFFRRDYGAVGLYDLAKTGALSDVQLVVGCVAMTLFLPCVAQFLMNVKERGWKTGVGISLTVLVFSFGTAYVLNYILTALKVVTL